jgi:hypothetical protein
MSAAEREADASVLLPDPHLQDRRDDVGSCGKSPSLDQMGQSDLCDEHPQTATPAGVRNAGGEWPGCQPRG